MTDEPISATKALMLAPTLDHNRKVERDTTAALTSTEALDAGADNLIAARVILEYRNGARMSLLGKMKHLTESAQDFHKETEAALDGISEKIALGRTKRDRAVEKHHVYYDAIIAGVDESTEVIDRLHNGPLSEGGEG